MISIFNSNILVLNSLRKPKRLEIIGDDESQHLFLVKVIKLYLYINHNNNNVYYCIEKY